MAKKEFERDITIGDRKITVHLLRVRDSAKLERLRQEAIQNPVEDADEQFIRAEIYPMLVACSLGDVPTVEEFLDIPLDQGNIWQLAVHEMNPGLFGVTVAEKKES